MLKYMLKILTEISFFHAPFSMVLLFFDYTKNSRIKKVNFSEFLSCTCSVFNAVCIALKPMLLSAVKLSVPFFVKNKFTILSILH